MSSTALVEPPLGVGAVSSNVRISAMAWAAAELRWRQISRATALRVAMMKAVEPKIQLAAARAN